MNILKIVFFGCSILFSDVAAATSAPEGKALVDIASYASPEGNGHVGDAASIAAPVGDRHVDIASYASPEGNGHVGDTASYLAPEGNGDIDVA